MNNTVVKRANSDDFVVLSEAMEAQARRRTVSGASIDGVPDGMLDHADLDRKIPIQKL